MKSPYERLYKYQINTWIFGKPKKKRYYVFYLLLVVVLLGMGIILELIKR
jgi:hypothetical protein